MNTIDWIIISIYLLAQFLVGLYFKKRSENNIEDYFLAGRKLSWWLLGTSMVATAFASDTPLFITKLVRQYGISGAWYYWNACINGLFAAFFISYLWRRTTAISDAEFREMRYSGNSGKVVRGAWAVYWTSASTFFSLAWVILAMMKICKAVFQLSETVNVMGFEMQTSVLLVVVCLATTVVYSSASGLWGVIVTDFIQFFLAFIGTFILAIFSVHKVGGYTSFKEQISNLSSTGPGFFEVFPTAGQVLVVFWVGLAVQWWASAWVDGGMMMAQRSMAAKSEKHAEMGRFFGHLAQMGIIVWPWIITGLCSLLIFPSDLFPQIHQDGELAYPMMVVTVLPAGIRAIVVAGLFAAFISTVSTILNTNASYVTNDLYKRFVVKNKSPKHYVTVGRIVTFVVMIIGGYMATVSTSVLGLSQLMAQFTGGVGAIFVLRWFWWRINAWSEISAYLSSGIFGILLNVEVMTKALHHICVSITPHFWDAAVNDFFLTTLTSPEGWAYKLVIISTLTTIISLIVTLLTPACETEHLKRFYFKVKPFGPGWAKICKDFGPIDLEPDQIPFDWRRLVAGTALFSATFWTVGRIMLGNWQDGILSGIVVIISGVYLRHLWSKLPS